MRARRPTRGPRTRVETREVCVVLHPARFPSRLSTARRRRGRRSDPNRDSAGGGPYRHPNDRSPRGALRGSAWFPARASRARASGSSTSVIARRSAFARDADASSSSLPPGVRPGGGSRLIASSTDRTAAACARADRGGLESMDARRGESGGHPPLRVHEDDDVPPRPGPPPRAARTSPPRWAARSVAREARRARAFEDAAARPRRTPRKAAASPAMAVPAPTATRGTPVPPTRRNTTSATRTASSTLAREVPSSRRLDRTPACIDPTRADRPSAPPEAAARSTTPWVSAAVSNSPATPSCVASSR